MQLKFVSPGKTVYRTEKCVAKTLTARNLELFSWGFGFKWGDWRFRGYGVKLPDIEDSPPDEPGCSGKKRKWSNKEENNSPSQAARKKAKVDVECHLFVCETTQLTDFVNKINETSCCSTPDCNGMYRSADYFLSVFSMQVFVCCALVILCSVLKCMFRLFSYKLVVWNSMRLLHA